MTGDWRRIELSREQIRAGELEKIRAQFSRFMMTNETEVKMIGLGLAVAVIVDVTLVRLVLAPGLISLLGEKAFWIPKWLNKALGKEVKMEH
jgi:RND superfamily putative drug exporter